MKIGFYPRLAADGIRKNKRMYIPYILTCTGMVMMYYIITFLQYSDTVLALRGGSTIAMMMGLGSWVIAVFAVIFLFYTNSFLIRRRKKEFGLYNILGMEKRHIAKVMLWETLFSALIAIGGGLIEVLVSPMVEACPTDNKEKAMSLLHSFYCWGHVGVVLISTIFFSTMGIENWKILARIWAVIPVLNGIVFLFSPIYSLHEEGEKGLTICELFGKKIFWVVMLMMTCAGASEQAVSQWASTFAEEGLKVSKTVGDLAGPMAFAFLMGLARLLYGKYGEKIDLKRFMTYSSILCVISYLCISFVPNPLLSLLGCAICGFSVGIMWPGTFSIASASIRGGGTAMFALLALAGDLGCSGGPTLAGFVSSNLGNNLRMGILAAIVFPILLLAGIQICKKSRQDT